MLALLHRGDVGFRDPGRSLGETLPDGSEVGQRADARRFQSEEDRLLALLGSRIPRHMRLFTG